MATQREAARARDRQWDTEMSAANRRRVIDLVEGWLSGHKTTENFVTAYWPLRRCLLDNDRDVFLGAFGEAYGELDSAINAYAPEPEASYEIDEDTLRTEARAILRRLVAAER